MEKSSYVARVNQLDSYLLDREILKIIHEQLANGIKELPPGLLSKFQPEIDVFLKSLIWFNSIYLNGQTFGQQILAITYKSDKLTKNKLAGHFLLTVFAPYVKDFSHLRFTNNVKLQKIIEWMEVSLKVFSVLNFFRFIKTGIYPSVVDYILRWNHISKSGAKMRNVGYAYMNRELMWTAFLELLNVTLPLINYQVLKRKLSQILFSQPKTSQLAIQPKMTLRTVCAICSQRPVIPHHIQCEHVFCYYCITGSIMNDPQFACPVCDFTVKDSVYPYVAKVD